MLAFQSEFEILNDWTNVKVLPTNLTFKKIKLLRLLLFLCKYMICERGIEALPKPASNAHFEMRKERKTKKHCLISHIIVTGSNGVTFILISTNKFVLLFGLGHKSSKVTVIIFRHKLSILLDLKS